MKKKLLSVILAAAMVTSMLAGCGRECRRRRRPGRRGNAHQGSSALESGWFQHEG